MYDANEQETQLRKPPYSYDAEQAVLAGLLLDGEMWEQAAGHVDAVDFYHKAHRLIFQAIITAASRNQPVDVVTVADVLREQNQLEDIGGTAYLAGLSEAFGTSQNVLAYADIVRETSVLRALLKTTREISQSVYVPEGRNATQLLDSAEQRVFDIKNQYQKNKREGFHKLVTVIADAVNYIQEVGTRGGDVTGIPTGFRDLDRMTAGMQPGDLIIIAGRPSMGKTTFAMNIAESVALTSRLPVAVFSLEMPARQLVMRMISSVGKIDQSELRRGVLKSERERAGLMLAASKLKNAPIYIDDGASLTATDLRSRVRRLKSEIGDLGLVLVDYLQLMQLPETRDNNRASLIGDISRALKLLAKEMEVPVIALSQLSRAVENRPDRRPIMSDIRESGAIEQDADVIMFVYRDVVYHEDTADKNIAEIIIGKQRNGPIGTVRMSFQGEYLRFGDLSTQYGDAVRVGFDG